MLKKPAATGRDQRGFFHNEQMNTRVFSRQANPVNEPAPGSSEESYRQRLTVLPFSALEFLYLCAVNMYTLNF